jgi:hypothetical protein
VLLTRPRQMNTNHIRFSLALTPPNTDHIRHSLA